MTALLPEYRNQMNKYGRDQSNKMKKKVAEGIDRKEEPHFFLHPQLTTQSYRVACSTSFKLSATTLETTAILLFRLNKHASLR